MIDIMEGNKLNHTYIIGGSPCSGKSTVAEAIADKFGFYYFKVDDFLDEYIAAGAASGKPVCTKLTKTIYKGCAERLQ